MSVLVFKVLTSAPGVLIVVGRGILGIPALNSVTREQFLGAFTKLREETISFVMSVRLSVSLFVGPPAWNSTPTGRIFMKSDIRVLFENISRKFMFHFNLT